MKAILLNQRLIPGSVSKKTGKPYDDFVINQFLTCNPKTGVYSVLEQSTKKPLLPDNATLPALVNLEFGFKGYINECTPIAHGSDAFVEFVADNG